MRFFLFTLYVIGIAGCVSPAKNSFDLLIIDAAVVDLVDEKISPAQLIGISDDTVRLVAPVEELEKYTAKNILEAGGSYIMPGLWDNHVHFRGGDERIESNRNLLPLYLAYGVTTVRDAGGDMTHAVLQWRKDIMDKELLGPYIFTSGPKLDGKKPAWPGSISVSSSTEAEEAVDSVISIGADYIKTYDGSLNANHYYSIIKAAELRGKKVTGHMPLTADLMTAVGYGLDGVEHMYYVLKAASADKDSLAKQAGSYSMLPHLLETYDEEIAQQVFASLAEQNFFVTPTLHIGKTLATILDADHNKDSLLSYVPDDIIATYERRIAVAKRTRETGRGIDRTALSGRFRSMVIPMKNAGIHIMAGSDCGVQNSYVYPGEALIDELQELVRAGLSPAEALRASIVNGSRFFDVENHYSQIKPGAVANLLILEDNPLESIENLYPLDGLILSGSIITREEMDSIIKTLKK